MPSRPPSPPGRTSLIFCTSVTVAAPAAGRLIDRIRAESRSVTSADPSGRNAIPHGALQAGRHRLDRAGRDRHLFAVADGRVIEDQPEVPGQPGPDRQQHDERRRPDDQETAVHDAMLAVVAPVSRIRSAGSSSTCSPRRPALT
jgi:hypothetical protein